MKLNLKTGLIALAATSLLFTAPALAEQTVDNTLTEAQNEMQLFENHLEMAQQQLQAGQYDLAYRQANDARYWFLAFSDSVATESPGFSWDKARAMEGELLETYMDLGQLYHITGEYQQAVNTLAMSLSVNPYQPDARYQQTLSYLAYEDNTGISDADDADLNIIKE